MSFARKTGLTYGFMDTKKECKPVFNPIGIISINFYSINTNIIILSYSLRLQGRKMTIGLGGFLSTHRIHRHVVLFLLCGCLVLSTSWSGIAQKPSPGESDHWLIADVPYVSQDTDFFCAFATVTMVLQYYGINVSLYDVLFYSGAGYSLAYSTPFLPRLPVGCIGASKWNVDRSFLGSLFGLDYDNWVAEETLPESVKWNQFWSQLKEQITNNHPFVTYLNPMYLPSMRDAIRLEMDKEETVFTPLENWVWEHLPIGLYHAIVIVGFNENNDTVCLHDPAAGIYGHPETGTYCWMSVQKFRRAIYDQSQITPHMTYSIETFYNSSGIILNETERVSLVLTRNKEKLQGSLDVYDDNLKSNWSCTEFGINTVKAMHTRYAPGMSRVMTSMVYQWLPMYHLFPFQFLVFSLFEDRYPTVFGIDDHLNTANHIKQVGIEKATIASYLETLSETLSDPELSSTTQHHATLLEKEAMHWYNMSTSYVHFLKKGPVLLNVKTLSLLNDMYEDTEQIIELEQTLL